uniref:Uncharacterized protein LOC104240514 n=1 Tax=Nicotiana sylvestris TaxID=4096 RepID=A0A1U7Y381_NICSY|nr:PREDICTED: uncharacterized protein LOC104240514 [Nicotiana sylvestris]
MKEQHDLKKLRREACYKTTNGKEEIPEFLSIEEKKRLGSVAISSERDVHVQAVKNTPSECQQGAAGVRRERVRWPQPRRVYQDNFQVLPAERLFIGGDFNGHIGSTATGYGEVHEGFGFGEWNGRGTSLRLLGWRCDRGLCKDCKVIPGEILLMQHRLLVMDVGIMLKRRKRYARGRPRIRWGTLTKDKAQELEGQLSALGAQRSSGNRSIMWLTTTDYIREAAREVLGGLDGRLWRAQSRLVVE